MKSNDSSFRYAFEPEAGRLRLTVEGELDDHVLSDAFRAIYTDPEYVPGYHELTDCRGVTNFTMTPSGVRRLMSTVAELQTSESPYRVAIVAPTAAVFGMARMYELMQGEGIEEVRVFRTIEEAESYTRGTGAA